MTTMTGNNYRLGILIPAVVGVLFSASTRADVGTFRLNAGIVPTSYKISFDGNAPDFGGGANYKNRTAKSTYLAANVGLGWISPIGVYADLSGQKSLRAKHDLWSDIASDQDFSHDTYTLTVGYARALERGVSVSGFGGVISGASDLTAPSILGYPNDEFDSRGFFVGAGAGMPALGGQISGSVAIAFMSGKWKDDAGTLNVKSKTNRGISIGGAYSYKLTPDWGVIADVRFQQYSYTFDALPPVAINRYDVKERIGSLGVRLSYQF